MFESVTVENIVFVCLMAAFSIIMVAALTGCQNIVGKLDNIEDEE